jgi:hypothetical protein
MSVLTPLLNYTIKGRVVDLSGLDVAYETTSLVDDYDVTHLPRVYQNGHLLEEPKNYMSRCVQVKNGKGNPKITIFLKKLKDQLLGRKVDNIIIEEATIDDDGSIEVKPHLSVSCSSQSCASNAKDYASYLTTLEEYLDMMLQAKIAEDLRLSFAKDEFGDVEVCARLLNNFDSIQVVINLLKKF